MRKRVANVSRRKFVAGAGAIAIGAGLAGCSSPASDPEKPDSDQVSDDTTETQAEAEILPEKVAYQETDGEWIPTTCNMCFNTCAILAHVVDGVVVELKGNPDWPGGGHICGKGAAGIMQLYDPNRITKPMKRTNPEKGFDIDPGWEEISWDEAYELIDSNIKETLARNPFGVGTASAVSNLSGCGLKGNIIKTIYQCTLEGTNSDICGSGVHQVSDMFCGTGNAMPDYKYCEYLLQFGTQAGTATRHGFNQTADLFAQRRAEGLRLVNFDPHMSAGAEKADLWVPILPGTDAAAALAIAHELVENGLIDVDYLKTRTNGPALVNVETGRIVRNENDKALFMDAADNTAKPYDECADPALEGEFEVDGVACKTGFTLYREHLATYTPEYQETITTVPADTIRTIAKEFGEAASIGKTITIDGVEMPLRPACADCFSGVSRHKHAFLSHWAIMSLNMLVGSANYPGGFIGYAPVCYGWADDNPQAAWTITTWEDDGLINCNSLMFPWPTSPYKTIKEGDFTPANSAMQQLMPFSMDPHFAFITQKYPEVYGMEAHVPELMIVMGANPIKWWGNFDEQAEIFKSYRYVIGLDIYLNESSYFFDLIVPEACYLERMTPLPQHFLNHRTIGGMDMPWPVTINQPVVAPKDDAPSILEFWSELADRNGKNAELVATMNMMYRVKDEYSIPKDGSKLEPEPFVNSILKSLIDEEHDMDWFRSHNGVYTYPRKVSEVYIWADGQPGRVPLYGDFMLACKERVEEKVNELGIPWETDDYQAFPDWKPCVDFEVTDPDYSFLPVYYTDAINTDTFSMENPWINEINEANPYAYTVEMNKTTADSMGLKSGDEVRLLSKEGASVEGKLAVSEGIHPSCVSVIGGHWGSRSEFMPVAQGKGSPIVHLIPGQDASRLDHVCAAFDQCVRIKIEKIA